MVTRHSSWEDRKPRNGREAKLRARGKPTPEYTRENIAKRCRVCKGLDRTPHMSRGTLQGQCVDCRRRTQREHYHRNPQVANSISRKHTQSQRELEIPKDPSGVTRINATWFHLHLSEVFGRAMNGETFLLTNHEVPICYIKPLETPCNSILKL